MTIAIAPNKASSTDRNFINGQYSEYSARVFIEEKIEAYRAQNNRKPSIRYMMKEVYGVTPSGRNARYDRCVDELEYLTGYSWRRPDGIKFKPRSRNMGNLPLVRGICIKKNFLIVGDNALARNQIALVNFDEDSHVTLIVSSPSILVHWVDCYLVVKDGALYSDDSKVIERLRNLLF